MKLGDYLKNTFKIIFHRLFIHLPFVLLAIGLWIFPIFLPKLPMLIIYIVLTVIGPIIYSFSTMLYGCFYADKYINLEYYPEYYHRGLQDYANYNKDESEDIENE